MSSQFKYRKATPENLTKLATKIANSASLNAGIVTTVSYWDLGACMFCQKNPQQKDKEFKLTIQVNSEDKIFTVYWGRHAYRGNYRKDGIGPILDQIIESAEKIAKKLKFREDLAKQGINYSFWVIEQHEKREARHGNH